MKIWLADLTHSQQIINSDLMPAAIASIASFVWKTTSFQARLFKYPEALALALDEEMPDVIGFSNYVWNSRLSYAFADLIKRISPATIVVFGGPNFPIEVDRQEQSLRSRPAIDCYVRHEGEVAFARLIAELGQKSWREIKESGPLPSIYWIGPEDELIYGPEEPRSSLAEIPSPYLNGFLDPFFDGRLAPILQTNRGCPFTCTFCVEGMAYYTKVGRRSHPMVSEEIAYIGKKISEVGGRRDLYIADSNFGMYKEDLLTCSDLAGTMERYGWPVYINTTTGKNQKARVLEAAKLVKGALRLSGSVQSLDSDVLANVKRSNIKEEEILELAMQSAEIGANSYSEIILGLPGDSKAAHFESLKKIIEAGFQNVYTWQLMMLPGSELDSKSEREKYGIKTNWRVLPRCFGSFVVRGEKVRAVEIEEVAVSSSTLSFEDYIDCRKLHLTVSLFYNDGLFSPFLRLLRLKGYSVFEWLLSVLELAMKDRELFLLYRDFIDDTRSELWPSFAALAQQADEKVEDYIDGKAGNNLIFTYRVRGLLHYLSDLVRVAVLAMRAKEWNEDELAFIDDAAAYVIAKADGIFTDPGMVRVGLHYAMAAFDQGRPISIKPYALRERTSYAFYPSSHLAEQLKIYGDSEVGIGRALMKTDVRKLYRVIETEMKEESLIETGEMLLGK